MGGMGGLLWPRRTTLADSGLTPGLRLGRGDRPMSVAEKCLHLQGSPLGQYLGGDLGGGTGGFTTQTRVHI